jgi:hypothetical protein
MIHSSLIPPGLALDKVTLMQGEWKLCGMMRIPHNGSVWTKLEWVFFDEREPLPVVVIRGDLISNKELDELNGKIKLNLGRDQIEIVTVDGVRLAGTFRIADKRLVLQLVSKTTQGDIKYSFLLKR